MTISMLTFAIILAVGFIVALLIGALIAWALGFDLNEPEYYEHRSKDDDTL